MAQDDKFFYKIPKLSSSSVLDFENEKIVNKASQEFEDLKMLNKLAPDLVEEPIYFSSKYSCLVNRKIEGDDLRDVLLNLDREDLVERELKKLIAKIAQLHQIRPDDKINYQNYEKWKELNPELAERLESRPRVINSSGISVRNFRYNKNGDLFFFDPSNVNIGVPESDLARLIFSLLIIRWGRNFNFSIFKKFDLGNLLKYYEDRSGSGLDSDIFCAFLDSKIKSQAKSVRKKGKKNKFLAVPMFLYSRVFFYQINKWKKESYIKLSREK